MGGVVDSVIVSSTAAKWRRVLLRIEKCINVNVGAGRVFKGSKIRFPDARSDRSRSRCRPLSRDQHDHETSSSHRDRGRIPRITATDDSAYDSARPPLSLRGVSTTPYSRGSRRTGSCYLHLPGDAGPGRDAR